MQRTEHNASTRIHDLLSLPHGSMISNALLDQLKNSGVSAKNACTCVVSCGASDKQPPCSEHTQITSLALLDRCRTVSAAKTFKPTGRTHAAFKM